MAASEIEAIVAYAVGHGTLAGSPAINHDALRRKGFGDERDRRRRERRSQSAFDIKFVFNKWTLGEDVLHATC